MPCATANWWAAKSEKTDTLHDEAAFGRLFRVQPQARGGLYEALAPLHAARMTRSLGLGSKRRKSIGRTWLAG